MVDVPTKMQYVNLGNTGLKVNALFYSAQKRP
jgi:hypothetical protein